MAGGWLAESGRLWPVSLEVAAAQRFCGRPSPAEGRQVIWPQAPRSVYFELAEIQPRCQPSLSVHHQAR